ncbi:MAG TPA: hypothetical protein VI006_03760 [Solirubrobacteraceae bacterium]
MKPEVEEVRRIAGLTDPVIRNLQITECYSRLAAAVEAEGANWCTFATWASRQAGRTIRGEDLHEALRRELGRDAELLHPIQSLWRALLRRGLFDRNSPFGRLVWSLHTPFDAFELAGDAVARGNRKVFAEIGLEFARYLASDFDTFMAGLQDPELRQAFAHLEQGRTTGDADLVVLANLEVGLHEQTRLQPQIREALDAATASEQRLTKRILGWPVQRQLTRLGREAITHCTMVLSLADVVLFLGRNLDMAMPVVVNPELAVLLARYEPVPPAVDDCGARDWSVLDQRMHYIAHLFRGYHQDARLASAPFTPAQVERLRAGELPDGEL